MKTIILSIENNSASTFINSYSENFEGETMIKALGFALTECWHRLTSQYDAPIVKINGIQLENRHVKMMHKKTFIDFQANFPTIREQIAPVIAILQKDTRVDYVRHIDVNNVLSSQSKFSSQEIAIFSKEQIKKTRFGLSLIKEDAKSSVWGAKELIAYELKQAKAKAKRIEAKKMQQIA